MYYLLNLNFLTKSTNDEKIPGMFNPASGSFMGKRN